MNYCEVQRLLQESSRSRNVFHTLFHGLEIDGYLEKHRILEKVAEVVIRACIDRPDDVADYFCRKLKEIDEKYARSVVKLEFINSMEDGARMLKKMSAQHHLPLIECVNNDVEVTEKLKRLEMFLKSNSLHKLI